MAKFSLFLMTKRGETPIADFNNSNSNATSFNEALKIDANSYILTFSLMKFIYEEGKKNINPLAQALIHGARVKLIDKNNHILIFRINNISYTFSSGNIQIDYSAVDSFQYELIKLNVGYAITDDVDREDYLGAMTFDEWSKKIVEDCHILYTYKDIDTWNKDLIAKDPNKETYNQTISFSCSDSNAYSALVSLGEKVGYILDINFANHTFSFIPSKSPMYKGYFFNPDLNLSSFSISTSSQSFITILDVTGPTIGDEEITLVPSIPPLIESWINSDDWTKTKYSQTLFSDFYKTKYPNYVLTAKDKTFLADIVKVPWFENRLINIDYYKRTWLLNDDDYNNINSTIKNNLRINNGRLINSTKEYLQRYEQDFTFITDYQIDIDTITGNFYSAYNGYFAEIVAYAKGEQDKPPVMTDEFERFLADYSEARIKVDSYKNKKIADLDAFITKYGNQEHTYAQLFGENIFNFRQLFNTTYTTDTNGNAISYGQYYYNNIDNTDDAIIIKCAQIASELTYYWQICYNCAMINNWYFIESWDCVDLLKKGIVTDTLWVSMQPLIVTNGIVSINDTIVPSAQLRTFAQNTNYPELDNKTFRKVTYKYFNNYSNNRKISNNYFLYNLPEGATVDTYTIVDSKGETIYITPNPEIQNILATADKSKLYFLLGGSLTSNYYDITFPTKTNNAGNTYTLKTYDDLLMFLMLITTNYGYFGNWWAKLFNTATSYNLDNYYLYKDKHDEIWNDLYEKYPSIFQATTYTNDDAANSEILYEAANNQFKDYSTPEPSYNLALMDILSLNNLDPYNIRVGDQIKINYQSTNKILNYNDELDNLMTNKLYVSSISYALRSDESLTVTVAASKFTDLLNKRLARIL